MPVLLALVVWGLLAGQEPVCQAAEPANNVVYLNTSSDWLLFTRLLGDNVPLARELVRQAFLLSAREELGLTTRDAWLGATMPTSGDNPPWEVMAQPRETPLVALRRGFAEKQAFLDEHELPVREQVDWWPDYRRWTEIEEERSRNEYVAVLKKAGYQGHRNAVRADAAVPGEVERLLSQMQLVAQFRAVRQLHALIRSEGESPALLGALVRGYAHLGLLTEYYWHPAPKVFKARALLYAQRMLAQAPDSPMAKWHRTYAAALAGAHAWAEQDWQEAEQSWQALAEKDRPMRPDWLPLIQATCRYDVEAFELGQANSLRELAALLKYVTVEQASGQPWAMKTALDSLQVIPECYRLYDATCQFGGMTLIHSATTKPVQLLDRTLYLEVQSMPGLPDEVAKSISSRRSTGNLAGRLLGGLLEQAENDDGDSAGGMAGEFAQRKAFIDALRKTGEGPSAALVELGEPAWDALALLLRELSFLQVYRRTHFVRHTMDRSADDWLTLSAPLVEGHPYRALLGTFAWNSDACREAARRLAEESPANLDGLSIEYCRQLKYYGQDEAAQKSLREMASNADFLAHDLTVVCRFLMDSFACDEHGRLAHNLWAASPHSPMARRILVSVRWEGLAEHLAEWDEMALRYPGLGSMLGDYYWAEKRWDDAERMLKATLAHIPYDLACRRQLANFYRARGDEDRWAETLKGQFQQPDYQLDHAQVQKDLAYHYMLRKEWQQALPYALGAAETGSCWGMSCAAECLEALQRWEEAEQYYRSCSESYRTSMMMWYFFCRRTGRGMLPQARQLAQTMINQRAQLGTEVYRDDVVLYHLLQDNPKEALKELQQFENPEGETILWLAQVADEMHEDQIRDAALERAKDSATRWGGKLNSYNNAVLLLALLQQEDLDQGGRGEIDLDQAERLCESFDPIDRFRFHFTLAGYFQTHGQPEKAERYWRLCMGWTNISCRYRTLVGAKLLERGITPDGYRELLEPEAEKADQSKPAEAEAQ